MVPLFDQSHQQHNISHYATCTLNLTYNGHSNSYPLHVVNTSRPTVLDLFTLNYSITQKEPPAGNPETKKYLLQ